MGDHLASELHTSRSDLITYRSEGSGVPWEQYLRYLRADSDRAEVHDANIGADGSLPVPQEGNACGF